MINFLKIIAFSYVIIFIQSKVSAHDFISSEQFIKHDVQITGANRDRNTNAPWIPRHFTPC